MTRYLLDTTALIDFSKRFEPAYSALLALISGDDELGICPVQIAEFYSGIPPSERAYWADFFLTLQFWPFSRLIAMRAGVYRYAFARRGQVLTTPDTLVAAVAWYHDAIVLTDNTKHYPMADVRVISLRDAPTGRR